MAEELAKALLEQIERAKKQIQDAEDAIRLAELMKVDVTEARAWLERQKRRLQEYEAGLREFMRQKGVQG